MYNAEDGSVSNVSGPILRAEALSHHYGQTAALRAISLSVPAGQMVGLLGPDGVGKSTLLGLIAGARKMQAGGLEVLGGDMRAASHRRAIGPRLAYMPQGLGKNLYQELSVQENLDFFGKLFGQGQHERRARIARLTHATGLHPFLARPAGKLSGGMKQKLGLCCALIHDPDLLILDEPTTGVDPLSRRQFWELIDAIRAERAGMSVLVSTAYMDEAERFDWLVAMDDGAVLASGSPAELKARTKAPDLEAAFVALLPEPKRAERPSLTLTSRAPGTGAPAIAAKGLTRRFGDFTAVSDVSFEIERGEIFGFLGSNGCGKTTTMKMLTGLLPASEGEAFVFGHPVDAEDLATRKRVGFMSQAFSLYGELTVAQNFTLHGRLYGLERHAMQARIAALVARFGLAEHLEARADALPLGIRQRLSLAVAIIHEPELLILDEPTSGVDPVARDGFWALLLELSRRDRVTIFISTHFMNEAMRCDRISLMHAGKVLVCDTPAAIAERDGAGSLEDAFIAYIAKAEGIALEAPPSTPEAAPVAPAQAPGAIGGGAAGDAAASGFSLTRLLAYSYLEMMAVLRDPVRLAFSFLGSAILLIVITYGFSLDVDSVRFAVLDEDQSPMSRAYADAYRGSSYFALNPPLTSAEEIDRRLRDGSLSLALQIPPDFGRTLARGEVPEIGAWIDGANTARAGRIESYVAGAHQAFAAQLARGAGIELEARQLALAEPRFRYNPSFESIYEIGPKSPALLLMLFPAILMAVSMAREKEIGTISNFYVTPTRRLEYLIGKQVPYIAITAVNFLILLLLVTLALGVPVKGSFVTLVLGTVLYGGAATGFGMLVSSLTRSQVAAVFAVAILTMLPTIQFSGLMQPVSTIEGGGRVIGSLWPTTYYMHLSVGAYTKGLGLTELWSDLLALAAFTPVLVLLASLFLKKQEA
ncbi:MAG: ribosome-associated ATPase/putative transporter RbbA [Neomegalonema sp.]|nr:ribosome-associated ATPase/putative transporter RbbA [Neomegalonema sp.]